MFAIILIIILVGFFAYYAYTECEDLVPTIFDCFCIVFAVSLLFFASCCFFNTTHEYTVSFDSYSISDNAFSSATIHYFVDDNYYKLYADNYDVFVGDDRGYFVVREKRVNLPEWFWIIAFIPDNMLIRTDVLIV